jgi:hypothetical protein
VAVGGSRVGVSAGGCGTGVLVGGGGGVLVGGSASVVTCSGVSAACGIGVSVGSIGVKVVVGVGGGVGVQLGVKVNVGRGVFVGSGVGVGTFTRSLPTEQPRLPASIIISAKRSSNLRLIDRLSVPFLAVRVLK